MFKFIKEVFKEIDERQKQDQIHKHIVAKLREIYKIEDEISMKVDEFDEIRDSVYLDAEIKLSMCDEVITFIKSKAYEIEKVRLNEYTEELLELYNNVIDKLFIYIDLLLISIGEGKKEIRFEFLRAFKRDDLSENELSEYEQLKAEILGDDAMRKFIYYSASRKAIKVKSELYSNEIDKLMNIVEPL